MSFLLLSGALLTLNPVYRIEPDCHYATYQALMQAQKADAFRTNLGILEPVNTVACDTNAVGIELPTFSDYKAAFRLAEKNELTSIESEQSGDFDRLYLFAQEIVVTPDTEIAAVMADSAAPQAVAETAIETATAEIAETVTQEDQSSIAEDFSGHPNDGDAGSSVFSIMNATIPTASAPPPVWKPLLSQQAQSGRFIFPLTTPLYVTSPYGLRYHPVVHSFMRHEGTDFRAASNSDVMSIADGIVVEASYGPVTGFYVTVRHKDGWSSRYLHLNQLKVSKNQLVSTGNTIGLSGNTGRTNGPHLHLEISHNDQLLNPMEILFEQRQSSSPIAEIGSEPTPVVLESVDMTPKIAIVAGEGANLQIGVRIGRKTSMYDPGEMVETEEGNWRIVKKFGKYKLLKVEALAASVTR